MDVIAVLNIFICHESQNSTLVNKIDKHVICQCNVTRNRNRSVMIEPTYIILPPIPNVRLFLGF